jgi:hypothetical protein
LGQLGQPFCAHTGHVEFHLLENRGRTLLLTGNLILRTPHRKTTQSSTAIASSNLPRLSCRVWWLVDDF